MNNGIKMVTIGGGSSYTPELIEGLIKRYKSLPVKEYWLVDIEEGKHKLEIIGELAKRMVKKAKLPIKIYTTLDRREALIGADFVTTQIRVGQLDSREKDESIPLKYGMIGQETNGAGGMFKALRTIPVILEIAKDMERICPDAWLINFTNPAGMITEALIQYSNLTNVIGLCNVPIHMKKNIVTVLGVEEDRVEVIFGGLNHMVFGLKVLLNGEIINDKIIELMTSSHKNYDLSIKNISNQKYEKEFLKQLGVIPCPYHNYYYKTGIMLEEELEAYKLGKIRVQEVKKIELELFEEYKNPKLNIKPPRLEERGGAYYSDAACSLIDSIYNDKKDIQTVNTKNNGAIDGFNDDSAVEVSCIITKNGPLPLNIGKLPKAVNGLVQQIKSFEQVTIEAAVEGNYEKVILALGINPLTHSDKLAKVVVNELMEAHKRYLPKFFNK